MSTAGSHPQVQSLNELVSSLKKEVILLRDELRVKDQMIISTSNMLHRANEELMQLRSKDRNTNVVTAATGTPSSSSSTSSQELTTIIDDLKSKLEEKEKQMIDWRAKVKEAIKENKRKEKIAQDEILAAQNQVMELQTQNRDLQYLKRTRAIERTDREVQTVNFGGGNNNFNSNVNNNNNTAGGSNNQNFGSGGQQSDFLGVAARIGSTGTVELQHWMRNLDKNNASISQPRALSLILTPPSRRALSQQQKINNNNNGNIVMSPEATIPVALQSATSPLGNNNNLLASSNFAATILNSPPPQIPELPVSDLQNAPPIIVSIYYGTADGWSVDTKLRVEPGQTIADLICITCDRINERYGKKLDAAAMCLRTHHPRAQRWVTIKDHRSVHSFAFFLRSATQSEAVKLQLEPLNAAEIARRQSQSLIRASVARQLQDDE